MKFNKNKEKKRRKRSLIVKGTGVVRKRYSRKSTHKKGRGWTVASPSQNLKQSRPEAQSMTKGPKKHDKVFKS